MNESKESSSKNLCKKHKVPFTKEEDQQIISYVNLYGLKRWSFVAKHIKNRTAKQCRDRYMNYLKPGISNNEWTRREDDLLINLYNKFGSKWSLINNFFYNRNQISLKNRLLFLQNHINQKIKTNIENINKKQNFPIPNIKQNPKNENNNDCDSKYENIFDLIDEYDEYNEFSLFSFF